MDVLLGDRTATWPIPQNEGNAALTTSSAPFGNEDRIVAIAFATPAKIRSRKVVTRSRERPTGKYPSLKANRMLQWESPHERNHFVVCDGDPNILQLAEQPCEITYILDGKQRRHIPDALVETIAGKELREVKCYSDALDPETARRTKFLTQKLPSHGYSYRLILAEEVGEQPRLRNIRTLLRFGRVRPSLPARERARLMLQAQDSVTWVDVLADTFAGDIRTAICRMALEGTIECNLNRPFCRKTAIRANSSINIAASLIEEA